MKHLPLVFYALFCIGLSSCTHSDCQKQAKDLEEQETEEINDMSEYVDKQIDKGIFFGQATKTLKFNEEGDTVSVISATWVAEDKLVGCDERQIQIHYEEVSREDIENKFLKTDSLK
ncbi:MAG: hypothetical protein ISP71_03300 [Flavobacteriales bacterium]|nr:hypothetical protein [Flavobacteriales bacterium]